MSDNASNHKAIELQSQYLKTDETDRGHGTGGWCNDLTLPALDRREEDVVATSEEKSSRADGETSLTFRGTAGALFSALLNSIPKFLSFR